MFNRQSLHVALLLWGCIFCLLGALCMFMSKNFDRAKRKWLIAMQLCSALLLLGDSLAWFYRGAPGILVYYIVRISNFFVFACSDVLLFIFHGYVCSCIFKNDREEAKKVFRVKLGFVLAAVGTAIVVISQFTDFYYTIDAGNFYHRKPGHIISMLIPIAGMMIDLSLLHSYRKKISTLIYTSMISYIILPLAAMVVQTFYYGVSLINIAISISMILMFVSATAEQNEELAMREKEAADLRISMMLSQIAPHFIYNTLTTIQEMCKTDPEAASETVGNFAGYLRGNLESLSETACIPFERELKHVKHYLSIEQKRFGSRVKVSYDIQTEDFLLPVLTLQPIVENAVKHGLCKKRGGGTVHIHTERREDGIYLEVSDDGVGFDTALLRNADTSHVGLKNVADRVTRMCQGTMTVESTEGRGTTVRIILTPPPKKENQSFETAVHSRERDEDDNYSSR